MPTTAIAGTAQNQGAAYSPTTRTATVEFNHCNAQMPWLLRRYGRGGGCIANGQSPASYTHKVDAEAAAARWIGTGL